MEPLVSVVIPVYNVEKYVRKCLDSVLRQTYGNLEIIIVNDGSTDRSMEVVYETDDPRIRVINQSNKGLSAARNTGVENSRGEYISFVDSDDFISVFFIELFLRYALKHDSDVVCCESLNFLDGYDEKAMELINDTNIKDSITEVLFSGNEAAKKSFYQKPSVTGAYLKLYKRHILEDIVFPEGRLFEDLATTYLFFQKAGKVVFIDEKLYAYRLRKGSIMSRISAQKTADSIWVSNRLIADTATADADIKKAAQCAVYRINRIVFAQISFSDEHFEQTWEMIKRYRSGVISDHNAKIHDRLLALLSFGGKWTYRFVTHLFELFREKKYSIFM